MLTSSLGPRLHHRLNALMRIGSQRMDGIIRQYGLRLHGDMMTIPKMEMKHVSVFFIVTSV